MKGRPRQYFRHSQMISALQRRGLGQEIEILDAGAGNLGLLSRLRDMGYTKVRGIDIEPRNQGVAQADICALPFKGQMFDVVFCGDVLEHVDRDGLAMEEIHRVLKSGGLLIVSVAHGPRLMKRVDSLVGHRRRYSREGFFRLADRAGFSVCEWNYWGFPLMRIYNWSQDLYCRLDKKASTMTAGSELFPSSRVPLILHYLFYLDNLFNTAPLGIGLQAVLVKA